MITLGLDLSSEHRSVGLRRVHATGVAEFETMSSQGRSVPIFAMVQRVLEEAGCHRDQVQRLVVGMGPGSYTGIRAAIAVAQGWRLAKGLIVTGVSSADGLARHVARRHEGRVAVVIDAQRGEFYLGLYEAKGGMSRSLEALKLACKEEVLGVQRSGAMLVGPEVGRWFSEGMEVHPSALELVGLAEEPGNETARLEPIYLREPSFLKLAEQPGNRISKPPGSAAL